MKIRKSFSYVFLVFLIVYFLVMLSHIRELSFNLITVLIFLAGLTLAIAGHARRNYITIILLVAHMSIEWFEWSQIGFGATGGSFWNIVHISMDLIFLYHELSTHVRRHRHKIMGVVVIFIAGIFYVSSHFFKGAVGLDNLITYVNPFVIAGILGCVGSHLGFHLRKLAKTTGRDASCSHTH